MDKKRLLGPHVLMMHCNARRGDRARGPLVSEHPLVRRMREETNSSKRALACGPLLPNWLRAKGTSLLVAER